jgi:hypothetical protein
MTYQVFEVIYSYYNFETIFKSQISKRIYLPKFIISNDFDHKEFDSLIKIYPEMKNKIIEIMSSQNDNKVKIKESENLYTFFMRKLLEEYKYKEFLNILEPQNMIKSCYIVIRGESIECGPIYHKISLQRMKILSNEENFFTLRNDIFNNLNMSFKEFLIQKGIKNYLEKISIELKTEVKFAIIQIHENNLLDYKENEHRIYYSSYSVNRISNSEYRCKKSNMKNAIFSSYDLQNLQNDCKLFLSNLTYGCLNLGQIEFEIDIEMDLLRKGYRICTSNIVNNETTNEQIETHCKQTFLPNCYEINFQREIRSTKSNPTVNKTSQKINLFPANVPHIEYIETVQMDFNLFIYTLGGIVGLWFGLTPINIADFFAFMYNRYLSKPLMSFLRKCLLLSFILIEYLIISSKALIFLLCKYLLFGFNLVILLLISLKALIFSLIKCFLKAMTWFRSLITLFKALIISCYAWILFKLYLFIVRFI